MVLTTLPLRPSRNRLGTLTRERLVRVPPTLFKYEHLIVREYVRSDQVDLQRDPMGNNLKEEAVLARTMMVADQILVKAPEGTPEESVVEIAATFGGWVSRQGLLHGTYVVSLPRPDPVLHASALAAFEASPIFKGRSSADYLVHATDTPIDLHPDLWGLRNAGFRGGLPGADIEAESAWSVTHGNRSVTVAVIDTGIN